MNSQLTQPDKIVNVQTNKQSIARVFNVKASAVAYLSTNLVLSGYSILYDRSTQTCWNIGSATGTVTSWSISGSVLSLVTSNGTFSLAIAQNLLTVDLDSIGDELEESLTALVSNRTYKVMLFDSLATLVPNAAGDIAEVAYRVSGEAALARPRGGGKFVAVAGSTTNDNGTLINSTGFYWKRIEFSEVTPQMFGAIVDGSTDNGVAIRTAVAYGLAAGIPTYLPTGNYVMLTGTITLGNDQYIYGDGPGQTVLNTAAALTAFTIKASSNNTRIKGMSIYSTGTSRTNGTYGIYSNAGSLATGIGYLDIDDVDIIGYAIGVYWGYNQLGRIRNSSVGFCGYGLYSNLSINMRIDGNRFNNNYNVTISITGGSAANTSYSAGILISNNEIVNGGYSGAQSILIQYTEHFTLSNNMIDAPQSAATHAVHLIGVARGTISSNWIGAHPSEGVRLENCQAVMVNANNILSHGAEGVAMLGTTTGCIINANIFEANTGTDILAGGTSSLNTFTNNQCRSSTASYSYAESASGMNNIVTGNMFNQPQTYDTVNIVFANNKTY